MDVFVLLTPIFLLVIVALFGFVGCQQLFGVVKGGYPDLVIDSIAPTSGPSAGGTSVQILGSAFLDADGVNFGSVDASDFSVDSSSEITATTPAASSQGPVDVAVSNQGELSNTVTFTYFDIGYVQSGSSVQTVNPPISVALANTTATNLLIAAVSYAGPAAGSVTVADNLGNVFTLAGSGPWFRQSRIFYLPNIPGGDVTITATGVGGASGPCAMCVSEYSGADATVNAIYNFSTAHSSNGPAGIETIEGVTVPLANAGDIAYVVVFASQDSALAEGPNLTSRTSTVGLLLMEDSMAPLTAAQPVATDDTTGGSFVPWVILAVAIKA
jgi:IPT/TIG domain